MQGTGSMTGMPLWEQYAYLEMNVIPIRHGEKRPHYGYKALRGVKLWRMVEDDKAWQALAVFHSLGGDGALMVMPGRNSENLVVLDCDDLPTLATVKRRLRAQGVVAPVVVTERGGHVYLRCRDGAVASTVMGGGMRGDVKGEKSLVVLPPSVHESGHVYRWEGGEMPRRIPTVSAEVIGHAIGKRVVVATGTRRLLDSTRDYLADGHGILEGKRNQALFDAARDYRYVGLSEEDALADLVRVAVASGLSGAEARATVKSAYRRDGEQDGDGRESLHRALGIFASEYGWCGRTARSDRAVFEALRVRRKQDAYMRKGGVFRASYRELAELARFNSLATIKKALERLVAQGLVMFAGRDGETGASLWRFTDEVISKARFFSVSKVNIKRQVSVHSTYCSLLPEMPHSDLKERGVLGVIGHGILSLMRRIGVAIGACHAAFVLACDVSTARRWLRRLAELGLVVSVGRGYVAVANVLVEQALVREASDEAEARVIRHDVERATWRLNPVVGWLKKNQDEVCYGV